MATTIKEIAALAQVSTATVSRVFSQNGYVSEDVVRRVKQIALEKGFEPKVYQKKARTAKHGVIAVIVPDIGNTYYVEVIRGIESVLNPRGIETLILNSDEDPRKEIRILSLLREMKVDGLITVPVSYAEEFNANCLIEMNRLGMPVVLLDRDIRTANIDAVFMDNFSSGYAGTQALIQNGHEHIAFICGPNTSTSSSQRLSGYKAALRDQGVPIRPEYIYYGDFKLEMAYHLTKRLIREQPRVTAIFVANSRMSRGSLLALTESGMNVPKDMAFISCGRLDGNYDQISSIVYPTLAIGTECANILLQKISAGKKVLNEPKKRITFDMKLLLNGSEVYPVNRACKREHGHETNRNTDEA